MKRILTFTLLAWLMAAQAHADITSNLINWWKLDDNTGTTATDSGTGADNGTLNSAGTTWSAAKIGVSAVAFNGSDTNITAAACPNFAANGTLAFWFKPGWSSGDSGERVLFNCANDASNYFRFEYYSDNNWYVGWKVAGTDYRVVIAAATMSVTSGTWYCGTVTWNDTTNDTIVYLGAVDKGSNLSTLATVALTGTMYIGSLDATASEYVGDMDEIRIYDRELSPSEVTDFCAYPAASTRRPVMPIIFQ